MLKLYLGLFAQICAKSLLFYICYWQGTHLSSQTLVMQSKNLAKSLHFAASMKPPNIKQSQKVFSKTVYVVSWHLGSCSLICKVFLKLLLATWSYHFVNPKRIIQCTCMLELLSLSHACFLIWPIFTTPFPCFQLLSWNLAKTLQVLARDILLKCRDQATSDS